MAITLTQEPIKEINADPSEVSRWTAAFNPVVFKFQREDHQLAGVEEAPSGGGIYVTTTTFATEHVVGDLVYINSGVYEGVFEILEIVRDSAFPPTFNESWVLDTEYLGVDTVGGYANFVTLRANYELQVKISKYVSGLPVDLVANYPKFRPDSTGLVTVNLMRYLQSLITARDESDFTDDVYPDPNLGAAFNIQWKEIWDGSDNSFTEIDNDSKYYIVNAARQVGDTNGQNMGEFVMFGPDNSTPVGEHTRSKFLSAFPVPTYFPGYPFDLGFIFSELLDATTLERRERVLDINGSFISTSYQELADHPESVCRMLLAGGYPANAKYVDVMLMVSGSGYVDEDFVDEDYVDQFEDDIVSEIRRIKIADECQPNSICLKWLNKNGSWDYWVFPGGQSQSMVVGSTPMKKNYVEDYETADTVQDVITKDSAEELSLEVTNIPDEDFAGLKHILNSIKIQKLVSWDPPSAPKWVTMILKPGTFSFGKSSDPMKALRFTLQYPEIVNQEQ